MCKMLGYMLMLALFPVAVIGQSDQITYAITSASEGSSDWVALRTLNMRTGKLGQVVLNMNDIGLLQYDKVAHKLKDNIAGFVLPSPVVANNPAAAPKVNTGVAAIAFDQRTNRLFYVSMSDDILRYIDLSTMTVNADPELSFSKAGNYTFKSYDPVNRLVITPDGYGYTITSDNRLIRFTTNNKPSFTYMGELKDDPGNKEMSILNTCGNLGGDMVADNAGNLYLITASNRVYKIEIKTRLTTYLATITKLPATFMTSGAAINENDNLLIGSSVYTEASFIVDHKSWQASPSPAIQHLYGIADLASSNVLQTKKSDPSVLLLGKSLIKMGNVKVYPNPVLFDEVNIQLNDLPTGTYLIELRDPLGRKVIQQKVKLAKQSQTEVMQIPPITAQSFYYIRVLNEKNALVSTHKLAVER